MDLFEYLNNIMDFFKLPIWRNLIYGFVFFLIIIWLSFVYWVYRDARLRNTSAVFWVLAVFVLNYLGLVIYLILRPPEFIDDIIERDLEIKRMEVILNSKLTQCPACGNEIKEDFLICPYCRKKLKNSCSKCGKPLSLDWKVCPYCKTTR
ncbi:MAG: zinc ribbon domain-containing protein [Actinobacteria bacterium]|nr:zinc ribbon domain-containing protein [Actinomycetota bacterium]MBL7123421.1 zinc ribbon domain-containing protein [Actinomycetota bacterium]